MTNRQRTELRISEVRSRLNEISGLEGDVLTPEVRSEAGTLQTEYGDLETRLRAAIVAEGNGNPVQTGDSEARERRELVERVELREYLGEAATGREATGAARELRSAVFGDKARPFLVPWEILEPRRRRADGEQRADAATNAPGTVGASQDTILGRVFADTAAMYLGVEMPMVPVGDANFPVLSAGANPANTAEGTAKDAEAATITGTTLEPRRLSARYLFSIEDASRLQGMEEALRADLAGAMGEAMDAQVLNGNGTAPNVDGFFHKLTAPTDVPSDQAGKDSFVGAALAGVDGRYARNIMGVRLLVGSKTYGLAGSIANAIGDVYVADYLIQRSGGFQVSAHIAEAPDSGNLSGIQQGLAYGASMGMGSAVCPIWNGFELIRDPYTKAAEGRVAVTAVALWNFAVLRTGPYRRSYFKVTA